MYAGLGLERYTRATSPLRRYSDLLVHQQARAFISGDTGISEVDMLARMVEVEIDVKMRRMADLELDDEVEVELLQINLPELDFTCRMV